MNLQLQFSVKSLNMKLLVSLLDLFVCVSLCVSLLTLRFWQILITLLAAASAAPGLLDYGLGHTAPAISYGHAEPAITYAHAAPAISYAHAAPAVTYAAAAPVIKSYAPAISYAAPTVVKSYAPAISYAAPAPVIKSYAPAISYSAPTVVKSYAAPSYAVAAPVVKAVAAPATSYSHFSSVRLKFFKFPNWRADLYSIYVIVFLSAGCFPRHAHHQVIRSCAHS